MAAGVTATLYLFLGSIPAQAGLIDAGRVDIRFDGSIFANGSDTLQLYYPDGPDGNTDPESTRLRAGMFHGSAQEPDDALGYDGFDPRVLYRKPYDVLLYCIDLFQRVSGGGTVRYDVHKLDTEQPENNVVAASDLHPRERNFNRTLDFLGAVNHILAGDPAFGFTEGEYNWLNPSAGWMSGAIQVGIWESLYEDATTALDVRSGDFRVRGDGGSGRELSSDGLALLDSVFSVMDVTEALDPTNVLLLTSDRFQDMIVGDPPLPVPAPAPAFLILAGLALSARRHAGIRSGNTSRVSAAPSPDRDLQTPFQTHPGSCGQSAR